MLSKSDVVLEQPEGAVFHNDWDNFDQLVSDIYGAGSIHTAVGIYMQDLGLARVDPEPSTSNSQTSSSPQPEASSSMTFFQEQTSIGQLKYSKSTIQRKKERSLRDISQTQLPPYYQKKNAEPQLVIPKSTTLLTPVSNSMITKNLVWIITRFIN